MSFTLSQCVLLVGGRRHIAMRQEESILGLGVGKLKWFLLRTALGQPFYSCSSGWDLEGWSLLEERHGRARNVWVKFGGPK